MGLQQLKRHLVSQWRKDFKEIAAGIFIFLFPTLLWSVENETGPVYCEAEYLEYFRNKNIVEGYGNVKVKYKNVGIYADYVKVDFKKEEVIARGNISFVSENWNVKGNTITYNLSTKRGDVFNASMYFSPVHYSGNKIEKISDEEFKVKGGLFTTCGEKKPHYRLQADSINIYLNNRIIASGVAFFIGPVPVFYLPVLVFPLREGRKSWLIPYLGYSQDKGWYVSAGYNYSWSPSVYGNVFFEYMERKGIGVGLESEIIEKKWNASSSLYYVRQGSLDRYKINLKVQPSATNNWRVPQQNSFFYFYLLSDTNFDREYGPHFGPPSNWIQRRFTTYASYSKTLWSPTNFKLNIKTQESKEGTFRTLPVLKFYTYPGKMGVLPIYTNWSSSLGNYYINNENYLLFNNRIELTPESLKIIPGLIISSNLSLQGVYWNENNTGRNGIAPGYKLVVGPRIRSHRDFVFHLFYNLDSEIDEDTYTFSPIPSQYLSVYSSYTGNKVESKISGNYDLLSTEEIWERFKKVRFDLVINPYGNLRFYNTTKYNVYPRSVQNISYVEGRTGNFTVKFGNQYFAFTSGSSIAPVFDLTAEVNATFGKYNFIFSGSYDLSSQKFRDRDYIIKRDLHCWEASLFYRELRSEIWFQVGIKAFPGVSVKFHPSIF